MSVATKYVLVALLLSGCSGCLWRKPRTAAVPPSPKPAPTAAATVQDGPLSVPQTRVKLPPPQPVDPAALQVAQEPPPGPPQLAPPPKIVPRRSPSASIPAVQQPEPPQVQPPVEERPRLQEIVSPEEKNRIAGEIGSRKRQINDIIQQASRRSLSGEEKNIMERVLSFVQLSDDAAKRGEMRQAEALSDRALVLARELAVAR